MLSYEDGVLSLSIGGWHGDIYPLGWLLLAVAGLFVLFIYRTALSRLRG